MSHQREYQRRHAAAGLCILCTRKAHRWTRCREHYEREVARKLRARAKDKGGDDGTTASAT